MKTKRKKKLPTLVLALVLPPGLLPGTAAEGEDNGTVPLSLYSAA